MFLTSFLSHTLDVTLPSPSKNPLSHQLCQCLHALSDRRTNLTEPTARKTTPESKISRRKAVSSACIPCRKRKSKVGSRRVSITRCMVTKLLDYSAMVRCPRARLVRRSIVLSVATMRTAITEGRGHSKETRNLYNNKTMR